VREGGGEGEEGKKKWEEEERKMKKGYNEGITFFVMHITRRFPSFLELLPPATAS